MVRLVTDVFVIQMAKELNFTEGPFGVHVIVESTGNLLDRNHLVRLRIQNRASNTPKTSNSHKYTQKSYTQIDDGDQTI